MMALSIDRALWTFAYDNSTNWALFGAKAFDKWNWYGTVDFNYIGGSLLIKLKYSLSGLIGAVAMWGIFVPTLELHVANQAKDSDLYQYWFNDAIASGFDYGVYATVGMILSDCAWNIGKMALVLAQPAATAAAAATTTGGHLGAAGGSRPGSGAGGGRRAVPRGRASASAVEGAADLSSPLLPPAEAEGAGGGGEGSWPSASAAGEDEGERDEATATAAALRAAVAEGLRGGSPAGPPTPAAGRAGGGCGPEDPGQPSAVSSVTFHDDARPVGPGLGGWGGGLCGAEAATGGGGGGGGEDDIPDWVWVSGFVATAAVGVGCVPLVFDGYGVSHAMVAATVVLAFLTAPGIAYVQVAAS